jgi:hypothetical protein
MFPPNQNRSNAKRKGPLQDLPMNPFTSFSQLKNNYPGIDAVFKKEPAATKVDIQTYPFLLPIDPQSLLHLIVST